MKEKRVLVGKCDLVAAANAGAMAPHDVDSLWSTLADTARAPESRSFDMSQLLSYAGGALVMMAMAWFMGRAWEAHSLVTVLALSLGYTGAFAAMGMKLRAEGMRTAGAVLHLLAVLMTPFTVTALLDMAGLSHTLGGDQQALIVEGATLLASLAVLGVVRTSLLTLPVFGSLWLLSVTAASVITGQSNMFFGLGANNFDIVSMTIGAVILVVAFVTDLNFGRDDEDYSYWGYIFGTAAFWIPLSMMHSGSEWSKLAYFGINILLMLSSVVLTRRVLLVAGSLGAIGYVAHVILTFVSDSLALPFVLILAGLGVIYLGWQYRKYQGQIERMVLGLVPAAVRKRLPGKRG